MAVTRRLLEAERTEGGENRSAKTAGATDRGCRDRIAGEGSHRIGVGAWRAAGT